MENNILTSKIEIIMFDLGGVLIELGTSPIHPNWINDKNRTAINEWFASDLVFNFEKGLCSAHEFINRFQRDLNINASNDEIKDYFTQWPIGIFPGVQDLLKTLRPHYTLAILSNTNELHWPRITGEFGILDFFTFAFASHQLKMAKPETSIFKHVIAEMKTAPDKILFLDDKQENIKAAQDLGIQCLQVAGIKEVQTALAPLLPMQNN